MSEAILNVLMRLFAIVANVNKEGVSHKAKNIVETYLKKTVNTDLIEKYAKLFDEYLALHHRNINDQDSLLARKRGAVNAVKVLKICQQINKELQQDQKILVVLQLLEYVKFVGHIGEKELDFIETVADTFNISKTEYKNCKAFLLDSYIEVPEQDKILVIQNKSKLETENLFGKMGLKSIYKPELEGKIVFLNVSSINLYVFYFDGNENLYLNGQIIVPRWVYPFDLGSSIRSPKIKTIYYSDISNRFLQERYTSQIRMLARGLEFKYQNSDKGVKDFNFACESGQLIGIMGGSGVGKSTLISVLNGSLRPSSGTIEINGNDIIKDNEKLKGIIGYVPQDDLLIEELTVFQNLYFNAKLCFSHYTKNQIYENVIRILKNLDLFEIKDLTVGSVLRKYISGGQRKRLNIALELLRSPSILFVDEPTTGLSSMDSEIVMDLLKEETLKGKLVIVNIHQPSSDIYKMFDKIIVIDRGGYPIYFGNPVDALVYFKTITNHVNAQEGECFNCGNVNPEQVLKIVEAKVVNEYGRLTNQRKISPKEWNNIYKNKIEKNIELSSSKHELPTTDFKIPNLFKQFKIFALRDTLSKITNRQYLLINLLEAPALALIIGYFTKYISGSPENPDKYVFSFNENLPVYIFMSVVVSIFIGLTLSAQEIIKDRKIIQRESFLNLSRSSYLNSKILIVFVISAFEMLAFVLIGNTILEIKEMTFSYWLILFSTAAFANMLGLNISASMNSVVNIYILIPFLLVPQLLFGGVIVRFDKLHKEIASEKYVPFIGDIMVSRWAYEALAVHQYKDNPFEQAFFEFDKAKSNSAYMINFYLPELEVLLEETIRHAKEKTHPDKYVESLDLLKLEIQKLHTNQHATAFKFIEKLNTKQFTSEVAHLTRQYLRETKEKFSEDYMKANTAKDNKYEEMVKAFGGKEKLNTYKENHHNESLSDLVLNRKEIQKIKRGEGEIIRKGDPIYSEPQSSIGRAHFYSAAKKIGKHEIDTYWFNLAVIWIMNLLLYFMLWGDWLKKLSVKIDKFKPLHNKKQ